MRREAATVHRRLGQGQVALQVLQVGGDDALLYDTGLDGHEGQGGCATGFLRPYPIAYPDDRGCPGKSLRDGHYRDSVLSAFGTKRTSQHAHECPLSGAKRTLAGLPPMSGFDPNVWSGRA